MVVGPAASMRAISLRREQHLAGLRWGDGASPHPRRVTLEGTVYCWGLNINAHAGVLGLGHTLEVSSTEKPLLTGPVDVGGDVVQLAAAEDHTWRSPRPRRRCSEMRTSPAAGRSGHTSARQAATATLANSVASSRSTDVSTAPIQPSVCHAPTESSPRALGSGFGQGVA